MGLQLTTDVYKQLALIQPERNTKSAMIGRRPWLSMQESGQDYTRLQATRNINLLSEQSHRCLRLVSMHTAQTAYPITIDLREAAVKVFFPFVCESLVPEDAPDDALRTANAAGTPSSL